MSILRGIITILLQGSILGSVYSQAVSHPGESLLLPDERTSLDDCHLRYYEFYEQNVRVGNTSKFSGIEYPFTQIAAIGWIQPNGTILFQCGGSLIWDNFVVTAAHCAVDSNNRKPNIVRFSDQNVYNRSDDENIQEIKIAEIIRHPQHRFSAHYHDIALMRLEKKAIINGSLVPACLWTDMEVRFKQMETAGWGRLGFGKDLSPTLQSTKLFPMSNVLCSEFYNNETIRKLKHGLADHHLCVHHHESDTCDGDSGGPLQVKLMHNIRQTPFIIALTSFGLVCGKSVPGVYTKVAPYHDWIIETMRKRGADVDEHTFNMTQCAHRYAKFRDFSDGLDRHLLNPNKMALSYIFTEINARPWHMVKLGWYHVDGHAHCYGMILDEDTVLTVADCTDFNGTPVGKILEPSIINITKIHVHPRFRKGSSYNNIAVLRLGAMLKFGPGVQYSCLWLNFTWPNEKAKIVGMGRTDLIKPLFSDEDIKIDPRPLMVYSDNSVKNSSNCLISDRFLARMQYGMASEHVCLGTDYFLVPGTCELIIGAPLGYASEREGRYYHHSLALIQFGRDCGFGEHMIATRLVSHIDWLNSVLLPDYYTYEGQIAFLNDNLFEGDSCTADNGMQGQCVGVAECSDDWRKIVATGNVSFCSSLSLICCPLLVLQEKFSKSSNVTELERCSILQRELQYDSPVGYMIEIGENVDNKYKYRCVGSIVTNNLILTTASCLDGAVDLVVQSIAIDLLIMVRRIVIHEAYNKTDQSNDAAVLLLSKQLIWSSYLYPVCLWMNRTHTPLVLKQLKLRENTIQFKNFLPMYNTDCQRSHPFPLLKTQFCGKSPSGAASCTDAGDILLVEPDDGIVKYLVGMTQSNEGCQNGRYPTATRISAMVDWIKQFIDT